MGLSELPPELKLEIYNYLPHTDLLAVSHLSQSWRSLVLGDSRWNQWLEMIVNPETEESARTILARFKVLDTIPARTIVSLCFSPKCSLCPTETPFLFLPLLKRICSKCFHPEKHAVMALSVALTTYDLSEKDIKDVVVLHWEETDPARKKTSVMTRAKLVSVLAVKNIAIAKHGGEENLATHLKYKTDRMRKAYEKRLAEYTAATTERMQLTARGDAAGAAAVTLKNSKKVPKTRPKMPAILKEPFIPEFYRWICVLATNFLISGPDGLGAQRLVQCKICNAMTNLRWEDSDAKSRGAEPLYPDPMLSGLIPAHEEEVHYAARDDGCYSGCYAEDEYTEMWGRPPRCEACLNVEAMLSM
ncbi:hypothetical protein FB451DRAFT_1367008 [Mycena latifolia]|nr:hypothetical protein FB451DRAFT_1367008 [Mycena latifolia]